MSPRAVKVTITLLVVAALLAVAYVVVPKVGLGHRHIDTVGKIVFLSDADSQGNPHVWIVNQDGSGMRDLTPGSQSCADPTFSPDGSQIAYISDKQGQQQVYIMDADGLHGHAITFGSAAKNTPLFSTDGKSLGFVAQGTLTSIDLQSNDTTPLLPSPEPATASTNSAAVLDISHAAVLSYAWSPAGPGSQNQQPEVAAVQEEVGVVGVPDEDVLTLLPAPNAAPVELFAAANISFCWAPDGSKIYAAVLGARVGPQGTAFSGIVSFTANGKPIQTPPLAESNSLAIGPSEPHISPDGKTALFSVVNNPDLAHNTILGIFVQPLDGSSAPHAILQGPGEEAEWSPDGGKILLLLPRRAALGHDLWVGTLNGSAPPINLTLGSGDVSSAQWSPSLRNSPQ